MSPSVYISGTRFSALKTNQNASEIAWDVASQLNLSAEDFYLLQSGKRLSSNDAVLPKDVHVELRLLGGKGGFGSMLRAIGAQIEKTTNREACRDLSGRRLRDINEEKRLKAWVDKQEEREKEAEERRKKKLERLVEVPKHEFKDERYDTARSELTEKAAEALEEGLKSAPVVASGSKRKAPAAATNAKKGKLWIGDDLSSSSETESDSETEEAKK